MQKKVYILIGSLFLTILLLGIISAKSCEIMERSSCDGTILMGLSGSTNAHGELWNEEYYQYVLCCDFERTRECEEDGTNKIIGLSDITNAHAEIPSLDNYEFDVCYQNLSCRRTTEDCTTYEMEMFSLTDETNAHIGGFDDYYVKICCNDLIDVEVYNYSIDLKEGWNLISIPLIPEDDDTSIESVFSEIIDDIEQIWAYQYNSNQNLWKYYTPTIGDLDEIVPGYGYYVKMSEHNTLNLRGKKVYGITEGLGIPPVVTLAPSWNLIGHYGLNSVEKDYAFTSLEDDYSSLFDRVGTPVSILNPTKGYWLFVTGENNLYAPSTMSYI